MENTTTIEVHNAVKTAFLGIAPEKQEAYRGYWYEIVFASDDTEGYAEDFLEEVNKEAVAGKLTPERLRAHIARWHEDLIDHRLCEEARAEGGEDTPWEEVKEELGL